MITASKFIKVAVKILLLRKTEAELSETSHTAIKWKTGNKYCFRCVENWSKNFL